MAIVEITENGITVKLNIRPATALDNLRREMLMARAIEHPSDDEVEQTMAVVFYPRCLSVTDVEIDGDPIEKMTLKQFCELPAAIFDAWWQGVIEENPRWNPARQQDEKKT